MDAGKWAVVAAALVALVNLGLTGWGAANLAASNEVLEETEAKKKQIEDVAEKAKNQLKGIVQTAEAAYFLHNLQLKRELHQRLIDMPSLEMHGPSKEKVIAQFKNSLTALETLERHVAPAKHSDTKYFIRGFLHYSEVHYQLAIESLQKYDDDSAEKHLLLGAAHGRLGNVVQAGHHFKKSEEKSGRTRGNTVKAKALNAQAVIKAKSRRFEESLRLLERARKADGELSIIFANMAAVYSQTQEFEKAITALCAFHLRSEIDPVSLVESDPDNTLDPLKAYLGDGDRWKVRLAARLHAC